MGLNDVAWEQVCRELDIPQEVENNGVYRITADEIKRISHREPRLMCKIDFEKDLPQVFREHDLAIVPEQRGTYAIGHFNLFNDIAYPDDVQVDTVQIGRRFDTLSVNDFTHESSAITASHLYGVLDGLVDDELKFTRFGRTGGGAFEYNIGGQHITADRTQIEMDGCFEGENSIVSLEAKIKTHDTFCIRQLYYPMRYLMQLSDKPITNVFLTAVGSSVYTHIWTFDDVMDYNSIRLDRVIRHDFFEPMAEETVEDIITNTPAEQEDLDLLFPQSDSMAKVFSTLQYIAENGSVTDAQVADAMDVDYRQGGYYSNATNYLGLTERVREGRVYVNRLSELGQTFIGSDAEARNKLIIRQMCRHGIFRDYLQIALDGDKLDKKAITRDLEAFRPDLGKDTPGRRAGTVKSWVEWARSVVEQ